MKCFEITGSDVIPGLPLRNCGGRPYVLLGRTERMTTDWGGGPSSDLELGRAIALSDELVEAVTASGGTRLHNCDLLIGVDGTYTLIPPITQPDGPGSDNPAPCLLLVQCERYRPSFSIEKDQGEILDSVETNAAYYGICWVLTALARVRPKGALTVLIKHKIEIKERVGWRVWRHLFPRYQYVPVPALRVEVGAQGKTLSVTRP